MRRRRFLWAVPVSLSWLLVPREVRADDVSDSLAEITRARANVTTLVATFTQERTIDLLASTVKSEGELTLVRPDRLRWELKPPDSIVYWITPDGIAYSTPSGGASVGKAAAARFGDLLSDLLTLLGGSLESLRARYEITIPSRTDGIHIVARPKMEELKKHLRSLSLRLAPDLQTVRAVSIEEASGDKSVITFIKVTTNAKVDPAKMVPPKK